MACHHSLKGYFLLIPRLSNKTKLIKERMSIKKGENTERSSNFQVKMLSRAPLLFSVGLRLLPPARQALRFNSSGGTVSIISLIRTKFQERKCWYHEIPIKISWFKGKKTKYICVYYTHELLKKIELGLEISLSGLLATLEPQTGCNWHANFFTAQTPFTVSIGYLFHCWAAVKPLQKQLGGVRQMCSTTCKMWLFPEDGKVTAFLERFQQRCPISVPAPVISTCPCVQKHRGKEEEKLLSLLPASLQHLQHSMASSGIGWTNF